MLTHMLDALAGCNPTLLNDAANPPAVVKRDIEKVEKDTAQSMSLLVQLDEIKTRLAATSGALQEADNWTTLSEDADAAFEAGDFKMAASKLLGMQRSLLVLSDAPDYDDRKTRLSMLQAKFEKLVTPRLEQAFSTHNLELAREMVVMLKDVNREAQVVECFMRAHSTRVLAEWVALCSDQKLGLPEVLSTFHDSVAKLCAQEVEWCVEVLDDSSCVKGPVIFNFIVFSLIFPLATENLLENTDVCRSTPSVFSRGDSLLPSSYADGCAVLLRRHRILQADGPADEREETLAHRRHPGRAWQERLPAGHHHRAVQASGGAEGIARRDRRGQQRVGSNLCRV